MPFELQSIRAVIPMQERCHRISPQYEKSLRQLGTIAREALRFIAHALQGDCQQTGSDRIPPEHHPLARRFFATRECEIGSGVPISSAPLPSGFPVAFCGPIFARVRAGYSRFHTRYNLDIETDYLSLCTCSDGSILNTLCGLSYEIRRYRAKFF
jgi:hypothetical protein